MKTLLNLILIALTGCSFAPKVPSTEISGSLGKVVFKFKSPKDTTAEGLAITIGTNGAATLYVKSFSTILNPTNIIATGNASAQLADSVGNAIEKNISAAANAAGALSASAAKTAAK